MEKVANKKPFDQLEYDQLMMCLDLMEELTLELIRCDEQAKGLAMEKKTL